MIYQTSKTMSFQFVIVTMVVALSASCIPKRNSLNLDEDHTTDEAGQDNVLIHSLGSDLVPAQSGMSEEAIVPTNITGVFLACEYVKKTDIKTGKSQIGCRLADVKNGHKADSDSFAKDWQWEYQTKSPGATVTVNQTSATSDPWHVVYDVAAQKEALANVNNDLLLGLKRRNSTEAVMKPLRNTTGLLSMLLRGNWEQTGCVYNDRHQVYTKDFWVNWDSLQRQITKYYSTANCTGAPDWEETTEFHLQVVNFDGRIFDVDLQIKTWSVLPRSGSGLKVAQTYCKGVSYDFGTVTDITKCFPYSTFHTIIQHTEDGRLIFGAAKEGQGISPQKRVSELNTKLVYKKLRFDSTSEDYFQTMEGQKFPYCLSANTDIDGDGWGWENNSICRVRTLVPGVNSDDLVDGLYPYCNRTTLDPNHTGWGWENDGSCKIR